ncbi:ATP-binding protein [Streptomyces sp. NBC_01465]|uniref:ATP-binding protein n=1 Tax=Streptomyces sp. NBC_01465 TaxID=2903878 RepID=UPI002E2F3D96|nr:ATP-binding protein [Streptomyces sp. NBC_01465]
MTATLVWCLGSLAVLLCAAVAVAAHARRTARGLRFRISELTVAADRFGVREAELKAETARAEAATARAESQRAAALSAAANAAGRMQALATGMLADLREMEHRHSDEDVLGDLLHLDHRTAQAGRLADSIAVLTGARSGRRWAKPIVMESILRGAMGRISGYQRVRLHSTSEIAVAGHAAEGVMHALAELLDNAANFSPPTAEVHVYVEEVPAGVILTVEDSGLVMNEVQLRRAEKAVATDTTRQIDLAGLSGTRLGLAVVGRLARKHGLTVSFRPSARGGTGVLMLLPQDLITRRPATPETAAPAPVRETTRPEPTPVLAEVPEAHELTPTEADTSGASDLSDLSDLGGLPRRRRGATMAAAHPDLAATPAVPRPRSSDSESSTTAAARFSTFRQAVRPSTAPPKTPSRPEGTGTPE